MDWELGRNDQVPHEVQNQASECGDGAVRHNRLRAHPAASDVRAVTRVGPRFR